MFAGIWGAGIQYSFGGGYNWQSRNNGITCPYISGLLKAGDLLYACTMGSGLFVSFDNADNWHPRNNGLTNPYTSVVIEDDGILFAGTQGGGVFASSDTGKHWSAANNGLTNLNITSLVAAGGRIFAGSWGGGIFASVNNGTHWLPVNNGLNCKQINAVFASGQGVYAGTTAGAYYSNDDGSTWTLFTNGLPVYEIKSMGSCLGAVFAGTADHGVYLLENPDESWKSVNVGLSYATVNVLALDNQNIFGGTSMEGVWRSALSDIFILETNPDTLLLDWDTGSQGVLSIETSVEWSLQGFMPDWLKVNKTSGTGNDSLVFQTLKANTTSSRRDAVYFLFSPKAKTVTFTVSQKGRSETIEETGTIPLMIAPNPVADIVKITSPVPFKKIEVYNLMGKLIKDILIEATEINLNLSKEQKGIYFLSIYHNQAMTRRIIVLL
jgi:ligand-binding sensor domain-containing protein